MLPLGRLGGGLQGRQGGGQRPPRPVRHPPPLAPPARLAQVCDGAAPMFRNQPIAVIGGGDSGAPLSHHTCPALPAPPCTLHAPLAGAAALGGLSHTPWARRSGGGVALAGGCSAALPTAALLPP